MFFKLLVLFRRPCGVLQVIKKIIGFVFVAFLLDLIPDLSFLESLKTIIGIGNIELKEFRVMLELWILDKSRYDLAKNFLSDPIASFTANNVTNSVGKASSHTGIQRHSHGIHTKDTHLEAGRELADNVLEVFLDAIKHPTNGILVTMESVHSAAVDTRLHVFLETIRHRDLFRFRKASVNLDVSQLLQKHFTLALLLQVNLAQHGILTELEFKTLSLNERTLVQLVRRQLVQVFVNPREVFHSLFMAVLAQLLGSNLTGRCKFLSRLRSRLLAPKNLAEHISNAFVFDLLSRVRTPHPTCVFKGVTQRLGDLLQELRVLWNQVVQFCGDLAQSRLKFFLSVIV